MRKPLLVLLALAVLLAAAIGASAHSDQTPPAWCAPYKLPPHPDNPYHVTVGRGRVFCWATIYDSMGKWDFPVDGCFGGRCVTGIGRNYLIASGPEALDTVATFATWRLLLPVVVKR